MFVAWTFFFIFSSHHEYFSPQLSFALFDHDLFLAILKLTVCPIMSNTVLPKAYYLCFCFACIVHLCFALWACMNCLWVIEK